MALNPPVVAPLTGGKLQTTTNVVASQSYADASPTDQLFFAWGNFDLKDGAPDPAHLTNPVTFPINANQVCDGTATMWTMIQDHLQNIAYSDTAIVTIDNSGNTLGAATLTAVDKSDPAKGMTVVFTGKPTNVDFNLGMLDRARISWTIYNEDGTPAPGNSADSPYVKEVVSLNNDNGYSRPGNVPTYTTTVAPAPVGKQYVLLVYLVVQAYAPRTDTNGNKYPQCGQTFRSAPARATGDDLFGPDTDTVPAPLYTNAQNGILDLSQFTGDIPLTIPQTPLISEDYALFTGSGKDAQSQSVPAARWTVNNGFNVLKTPYTGATIPRSFVDAVPDGGSYTISYTAQKINKTSPTTTVTIKKGGTPPPDASVGQLFGWGNSTFDVLG